MNIGTRPTVDSNESTTKIEAHLLKNEHYELYGTQLKIEPSVFMREEIKFENLDQLRNQIQRDCQQAKYLLG
ncbi:MAG: riboflavin kinase [Proteobacteria bacterium]|nr:riboflavin kinase [Pseudomonadota bacterium]